MATPAVLKGTRDFLPHQIAKREYLFDTIRTVYQKYGFMPIETPAMERSETLLGKYGEEGDRLIFKVLNNGDFMSKVEGDLNSSQVAQRISKRAMRYDLTVPFARFVAEHRNELQFPFKRYQIQPVWRADRPQKGRYQEFYQCDADVVGSSSLIHEVEFVLIFDEVLTRLGLESIEIRINNRKILTGFAEVSGCAKHFSDMAVALDKLDKVGEEKVKEEWIQRGISAESIDRLSGIFNIAPDSPFDSLMEMLGDSSTGREGIEELSHVWERVNDIGLQKARLILDPTLARGLDYYTGAIFEVVTEDYAIGSICGGGRYADLTGVFGLADMPGVGISFGADRIYDVLEATNKWPDTLRSGPEILFVNFGEEEAKYCFRCVQQLRAQGVATELYPTTAKMKKQMKYAGDREIPFVALVGEEEVKMERITLKQMSDGEQSTLSIDELVRRFE